MTALPILKIDKEISVAEDGDFLYFGTVSSEYTMLTDVEGYEWNNIANVSNARFERRLDLCKKSSFGFPDHDVACSTYFAKNICWFTFYHLLIACECISGKDYILGVFS